MDDLWATKSENVGLIVHAISFQDFQSMWSWSTNVTERQTDRLIDDMWSKTVYSASCGKNYKIKRDEWKRKQHSVALNRTTTCLNKSSQSHLGKAASSPLTAKNALNALKNADNHADISPLSPLCVPAVQCPMQTSPVTQLWERYIHTMSVPWHIGW